MTAATITRRTGQRKGKPPRTRSVRRVHCGGCGRFIGRDERGRPAEHVMPDGGGGFIYWCKPIPPHERPEPMDVPLPFEEITFYTCQRCQQREDLSRLEECFPLCSSCEVATEYRHRPQVPAQAVDSVGAVVAGG